jgi:hypothetical protein
MTGPVRLGTGNPQPTDHAREREKGRAAHLKRKSPQGPIPQLPCKVVISMLRRITDRKRERKNKNPRELKGSGTGDRSSTHPALEISASPHLGLSSDPLPDLHFYIST